MTILSDKIVESYCDDVGNWTSDNIEVEHVKEFIKELKETISSSQCRVRNFLGYNDDHCLSEKLVLHHLNKLTGDALCTKDESEEKDGM